MQVNIKINPSLSAVNSKMILRQKFLSVALDSAIKKSALLIERNSKKTTPVDTGRLRSSIYTKLGTLSASIQPKTNYAIFVHEGTRYMKANPFMKNGLKDSVDQINQIVKKEVHKALNI